jgi:hypothetical protein
MMSSMIPRSVRKVLAKAFTRHMLHAWSRPESIGMVGTCSLFIAKLYISPSAHFLLPKNKSLFYFLLAHQIAGQLALLSLRQGGFSARHHLKQVHTKTGDQRIGQFGLAPAGS